MAPTMKELGIDQLSVEDRLSLANEILDSAAAEVERQPLTDAQRTEIERRIAEADADPSAGVPWEAVKAAALARAKR